MDAQKLSHRDFVKLSGLALSGVSLACSGLGFAATCAGSTPEIAAAIGETLAGRGLSVEVKPVKAKPSLNGYGAVILGSAIRMSNWLPEMIEYIKTNQMALKQSVTMGMPVARFTVHILNTRDDEASRTTRTAYTASVRQPLIPTEEVFFAGKIDCARLSLLDRLMAMAVEKQTGTPPGNYRNWEQIRGWAGNVLS